MRLMRQTDHDAMNTSMFHAEAYSMCFMVPVPRNQGRIRESRLSAAPYKDSDPLREPRTSRLMRSTEFDMSCLALRLSIAKISRKIE
jgi:hypothetical protein